MANAQIIILFQESNTFIIWRKKEAFRTSTPNLNKKDKNRPLVVIEKDYLFRNVLLWKLNNQASDIQESNRNFKP